MKPLPECLVVIEATKPFVSFKHFYQHLVIELTAAPEVVLLTRMIALYKRHRLPVSPDKGSAAKQRNEAFKADVKEQFETCKDKDQLAQLPVDADGCEALLEFVTGDSKTIKLSMKPTKPVSVGQLFVEGMRGGPDRAARLLNPQLEN